MITPALTDESFMAAAATASDLRTHNSDTIKEMVKSERKRNRALLRQAVPDWKKRNEQEFALARLRFASRGTDRATHADMGGPLPNVRYIEE